MPFDERPQMSQMTQMAPLGTRACRPSNPHDPRHPRDLSPSGLQRDRRWTAAERPSVGAI
jgi:hypothetical protein